MSARQEDFVFAEHVMRRGFATEQQVEECLSLLDRLRGEMSLDETLANILLKKGYIAQAQAAVIEQTINPSQAARPKNQIEGYRLLARLGSGAMGSVYKAQHLKLDIPVALKVLRVDLAKNKTQIERLKREAQLAARLNHRNIVRSLDVGESNGFHYFAMEYADGATVRQLVRRGGIREKEAFRIIRDVARGLEAAHGEGVIHRDIKPGNIILTRDGTVKLADFGLARGKEPSDLTMEHASIGTPQYLAPEQARSGAGATSRSDLFSLGATLYHMVTGRPPFSGDNLGQIFQQVLACQFDPPESIVPDLSIDTVYLIHRLMRANPRERYASATELIADLDKVEAGVRIAPPDFKGDYQAYLRKRRMRRLVIGSAAIALVAIATFLTASRVRETRARKQLLSECRALDGTGEGEVADLDSSEALEQKLGEMERARDSRSCAAGVISGLENRIRRTRRDLDSLKRARGIVEQARAEGTVPYRDLHERLGDIQGITPGTRRRLREHLSKVAWLSTEAARLRRDRLYSNARKLGAADAVARMRSLADDLQTRYVEIPEPWKNRALRDADELEKLHDSWKEIERKYGPRVEEELEGERPDFAAAYRNLQRLLREQNRAKSQAAVDGQLSQEFLVLFKPDVLRDPRIFDAERKHWSERILPNVKKLREDRPDLARQLLADFMTVALEPTKPLVREMHDAIHAELLRKVADQMRELEVLEVLFRRALKDRLYAAAARRVTARRGEVWLVDAKDRFDLLEERATAVRGLIDQFLDGVREVETLTVLADRDGQLVEVQGPGRSVRPAPGQDEDRFVMTVRKEQVVFNLSGLKYDNLKDAFRFDRGSRIDIARRGYFNAAEALRFLEDDPYKAREADPYKARDALGEAITDLQRVNDPWAGIVSDLADDNEEKIRHSESRAEALFKSMDEAYGRKDHVSALARCEDLQRLRWTNFCKPRLAELARRYEDLNRLAGKERKRLRSGVPADQFDFDPESGLIKIRYTGRIWNPYEGEVQDPEILQSARYSFWTKHFLSEGVPRAQWKDLYQRAIRQLLDWEGPVEAGDGRYRYCSRDKIYWENGERWIRLKNYRRVPDPPRVLELRNSFDPGRDWRLEFTVAWTRDKPGDAPREPGLFIVSAGRLQGGILYWKKRYGNGRGISLYEEEEIGARVGEHFVDFHEHLVENGRRRPRLNARKGKSYFDRFLHDVPYRVRLERVEGEVRFLGAPLPAWERAGRDLDRIKPKDAALAFRVQLPMRPRKLESALVLGDGRTVFRFFGLVRFDLTDVEVRGYEKAGRDR